jgi:hypothetical protein
MGRVLTHLMFDQKGRAVTVTTVKYQPIRDEQEIIDRAFDTLDAMRADKLTPTQANKLTKVLTARRRKQTPPAAG